MGSVNKIVIVDDDPIYIFTVKRFLKFIGFEGEVLNFNNGKTAFEEICGMFEAKTLPDLVLLDVNMPVWDGWDFLDEINAKFNLLPIRIFICSSSNSEQDINKSLKYEQLEGYLVKPLDVEKLRSILLKE